MTQSTITAGKQPTKLFNRNFFLQWQGQAVSKIGSQVYYTAMVLWIKNATGSAAIMGLYAALSAVPGLLLGPIGGVLADRYSRRKIIILSNLLNGLSILTVTGLLVFAPEQINLILLGLFAAGVFNAIVMSFFGPAISATIPDLVPPGKVTSANSANQLTGQLALFVGQGLGATLFRVFGAPILFFFNSLSFFYAGISELFVEIPQKLPDRSKDWREELHVFGRDLKDSFRYVVNTRGLREAVVVSAILGFFTAPLLILMPFFVEDFLQVSIDWYGFFAVGFGFGTLLGYLFAGTVSFAAKARGRVTMAFIIIQSLGIALFGLTTSAWVALALALIGGFVGGYVQVNIQTIVQVSTPGEMRGRVFGLLGTLSTALTPISMGLAGIVADLLNQNIPLIYGACGLIMTGASIFFAFNRPFRQWLAYDLRGAGKPTNDKAMDDGQ